MLYTSLKFIHILAVVVWIGGLVAVAVLNGRFARQEQKVALIAMVRQSRFLGTRAIAPAAAIGLLSGIGAMAIGKVGFTLWIVWGIVTMAVSLVLGATVLRSAGNALAERLVSADRSDPLVIVLEKKLATWSAVNLLLLLTALWMMVAKPTL